MYWRRAGRRAGGIAPWLAAVVAVSFIGSPRALACINDGTPAPCHCLMKILVQSAAAQSFTATPTLTNSSAPSISVDPLASFAPTLGSIAGASQAVHVGTDTSTGQTVYYYTQANITINPGDTVTWLLDGSEDHTVTSDLAQNNPQYFDSGSMVVDGGSYQHTFTTPGVYHYHCVIHDFQLGNGTWAGLQLGTVTVTPEPTSAAILFACAGGLLWRRRRS